MTTIARGDQRGRRARRVGLLAVAGLLVSACGGDDPAVRAAVEICAAIDAEPDDEAAFEGYERAVARERRSGIDENALSEAIERHCGRAVVAISAPRRAADPPTSGADTAPEVEPADPEAVDPEPVDPDPMDLDAIDWASQSWRTTCAVDDQLNLVDGPAEVTLVPSDNPDGFGWGYAHPEAPIPWYSVDIDSNLRADVTGDGADEALFRDVCIPGNVVQPGLAIWTVRDGQARQLPELRLGGDRAVVLDGFEVVDGVIRVQTREPAPGASPAEGYLIEVTTDWTFNAGAWKPQERTRVDKRPPPGPPATAVAGCETPNASAQDAALCLVAAVNAEDYASAAMVASPDAVELLRDWRYWGPIEWEFSGCSETCWFYEPSSDPRYHGVGIEMGIGTRHGGTVIEWVEAYG